MRQCRYEFATTTEPTRPPSRARGSHRAPPPGRPRSPRRSVWPGDGARRRRTLLSLVPGAEEAPIDDVQDASPHRRERDHDRQRRHGHTDLVIHRQQRRQQRQGRDIGEGQHGHHHRVCNRPTHHTVEVVQPVARHRHPNRNRDGREEHLVDGRPHRTLVVEAKERERHQQEQDVDGNPVRQPTDLTADHPVAGPHPNHQRHERGRQQDDADCQPQVVDGPEHGGEPAQQLRDSLGAVEERPHDQSPHDPPPPG